jgi:hypothetical protein
VAPGAPPPSPDELPYDAVTLPPEQKDIQKLLDSVRLPADMPEAEVPAGVRSTPKAYQRQVRALGLQLVGQPCWAAAAAKLRWA